MTVDGPARAAIQFLSGTPEFKLFTAEMSAPDNLALHLFNYPAWRVEVNGRQVQPGTREGTGQMLVPVEAGANRVQIIFVRPGIAGPAGGSRSLALLLALVIPAAVAGDFAARSRKQARRIHEMNA